MPEAAFAAWTRTTCPTGSSPGLEATRVYDPPTSAGRAGAHVAVVQVDTETGAVDLVRYVAVDDLGTVINPMIVDGQVHGGIAQGSPRRCSRRRSTTRTAISSPGSLASYLVPSAAELPSFELDRTVTPSPTNPLGVKGVGETGAIASPAAVMNAVVDALAAVRSRRRGDARDPGTSVAGDRGGGAMIPDRFEYEVAESVDHAVELLGLERRREADRRRPFAAAVDAAAGGAGRRCSSTSGGSDRTPTSARTATGSRSAPSPATTTSPATRCCGTAAGSSPTPRR